MIGYKESVTKREGGDYEEEHVMRACDERRCMGGTDGACVHRGDRASSSCARGEERRGKESTNYTSTEPRLRLGGRRA